MKKSHPFALATAFAAFAALIALSFAPSPARAGGDSDSGNQARIGTPQSGAHWYRGGSHRGRDDYRQGHGGHWGRPGHDRHDRYDRHRRDDRYDRYRGHGGNGHRHGHYGPHWSGRGYRGNGYRPFPSRYPRHNGYWCGRCNFRTSRYSLFYDHVFHHHGIAWHDIAAHIIFDPVRLLFTFGTSGHNHHWRR